MNTRLKMMAMLIGAGVSVSVAAAEDSAAVTNSNSAGAQGLKGKEKIEPTAPLSKELPILIHTWNSVSDPSAGTAMYRVDPDGGEVTEIPVPKNDRSFGPWWSTDGKWIYYQAKIAGQYPTARCRPDGSEHSVFTVGLGPMALTTNLMADNRDGHIGVSDPDGSNYRNLVGGKSYMQSISADGRKVIYSTFGSYYMNCVDVATKAVVTLTHPGYMGQPSPDNQWVVYFGPYGEVFRVPLGGGTPEKLTTGAGSHTWYWFAGDGHGSSDPPKISPDGSKIVYGAKVNGVDQVWVMDINGANKRQVTSLPGVCGRRHWNTRGDRIAFISWVGSNAQVFVVDLKPGATPVQLTHFTGTMKAGMLTWAPSNGPY